MSEPLDRWLRRQLPTVDQDGSGVARLELTAGDGGAVFDSWLGPWGSEADIEKLSGVILETVAALAEAWPSGKRHLVILTALDGQREVRARWQHLEPGKSKTAGGTLMSGPEAALSSIVQQFAETTKNLLGTSNVQIAVQSKTIEQQAEHIHALHELLREKHLAEVTSREEGNAVARDLLGQLGEHAPALIELAAQYLKTK